MTNLNNIFPLKNGNQERIVGYPEEFFKKQLSIITYVFPHWGAFVGW